MMPLMLLLSASRRLGSPTLALGAGAVIAVVALGVLLWRRRHWRQWDEARLLLVLTARVSVEGSTDQSSRPERVAAPFSPGTRGRKSRRYPADETNWEVAVMTRPGSGRTVTITAEVGRPVVTVGPHARPYAQWIAGQMLAMGYAVQVGPTPLCASEVQLANRRLDGCHIEVEVLWAETIESAPPHAKMVLPSRPVGSSPWSMQMDTFLILSKPLPELSAFEDLVPLFGARVGCGVPVDSSAPVGSRTRTVGTPAQISGSPGGAVGVPIGVQKAGPFLLNLPELGPHALVVGGTGSGKSEFLTTLVLSHALLFSPSELRIVLLDFKGGAGLSHLRDLPHVEHCLTDLDGALVPWLLRALGSMLVDRKRKLQIANHRSWEEWGQAPPRLLVVVDEFHVLAQTHPDLMEELVAVAAQGRSLGLHLVLATQRPSGAVTAQMKATLDLRVALRCREVADSLETIGSRAAAELPRIPGRALINGVEVQTALVTEVTKWVRKVRQSFPHPPVKVIPDPLPERIAASSVGRPQTAGGGRSTRVKGALGLYEQPGRGNQTLRIGANSVAIVGPPTVKNELSQIAHAVVAAQGGNTGDLSWIGTTSALGPAVRRLQAFSEGRSKGALVIDGVSDLFAKIESASRPDVARALWEKLLQRATSGGLTLIATDTRARYDLLPLSQRLIRLPDLRQVFASELASYLPTSMPNSKGLPVQRPSDLGRFASPTPGRVLAQGFVAGEVVWAQLALPPTRLPTGLSQAPESSQVDHCSVRQARSALVGALKQRQPVWLIGPRDFVLLTGDELAGSYPATSGCPPRPVQVLTPEQWPTLAAHLSELIVAVEPTAEIVRLLCRRHPEQACWLLACQPYRSGQTLLATDNAVYFVNSFAHLGNALISPSHSRLRDDSDN